MTSLGEIVSEGNYSDGGYVPEEWEASIAARVAEMERSESKSYRHFRPLKDAAYEYISWAEHPELRVYTGIRVLDAAMRGTAPGELTLIQGFTHSGKGLLVTELLLNNEATPLLMFTPDETRSLVLTKLTAAHTGVSAKELERRIQKDDADARQLMLDVAERYAKLAVFEDVVTIPDMDRMLDETCDALGEKPRAFIFDYADLLAGFDDVRQAISALKDWGKRHSMPGFVLHQASRSSGSGGKKMTIDSGAYGGEAQATHVIGIRRKKYQHYAMLALLEEKIANASNPNSVANYEAKMREIREVLLPADENTITVSLVKNKRPPSELVEDVDFALDTATGRMIRMDEFKDRRTGEPIRVTKAQLSYLRTEPQPWEDREMF